MSKNKLNKRKVRVLQVHLLMFIHSICHIGIEFCKITNMYIYFFNAKFFYKFSFLTKILLKCMKLSRNIAYIKLFTLKFKTIIQLCMKFVAYNF